MSVFLVFGTAPGNKALHASVMLNKAASATPAHKKYSSSLSGPDYTSRGDWEIPDILLMTWDPDWRAALEIIAAAADTDGIPVYYLSDKEDLKNPDYISWIKKLKHSRVLMVSYDTPWVRDYGPLQVKELDNTVHWLDYIYTADRPLDDTVPQQVAGHMKTDIVGKEFYLEGGAIISNGKGLCAMTTQSLEEASLDEAALEDYAEFRSGLGCRAIAVLPALTGESTGHADIIAQFLAPDIVAVAQLDNSESSLISSELDLAVTSLIASADSIGQGLRVIRLPMYVDGDKFYSYTNSTRLKNSYLVPSFQSIPAEMEKKAYKTIQSAVPGLTLVPVPADEMVYRGGAVHCITLGLDLPTPALQPKASKVKDEKPVTSGTDVTSLHFYTSRTPLADGTF